MSTFSGDRHLMTDSPGTRLRAGGPIEYFESRLGKPKSEDGDGATDLLVRAIDVALIFPRASGADWLDYNTRCIGNLLK